MTYALKQIRIECLHQIAGPEQEHLLQIVNVLQHIVLLREYVQYVSVGGGDTRLQEALEHAERDGSRWHVEIRDFVQTEMRNE